MPVSDSEEAQRAAANCEERAKPCDAGEPAARGGGTALLAACRALCSSKAAKPAKAGEGCILWRGMGDMRASSRFLAMGGTEFACCSTTSRLEVAARYASAAGKQRALLFRLKSSTFMNMGVDISEFSAFPHEKEYLYPPLTYTHPTGVTHTLVRDGVTFDVVTPTKTQTVQRQTHDRALGPLCFLWQWRLACTGERSDVEPRRHCVAHERRTVQCTN